jgi:hypothetical protein
MSATLQGLDAVPHLKPALELSADLITRSWYAPALAGRPRLDCSIAMQRALKHGLDILLACSRSVRPGDDDLAGPSLASAEAAAWYRELLSRQEFLSALAGLLHTVEIERDDSFALGPAAVRLLQAAIPGYMQHWYMQHWYMQHWYMQHWYMQHWYMQHWYMQHW